MNKQTVLGLVGLIIALFLLRPTSAGAQTEDTSPPVVSNVKVTGITATNATINWSTDEDSVTYVEYGLAKDYAFSIQTDGMTRRHSIRLRNLTPGRLYYFRLEGRDAVGNVGFTKAHVFRTTGSPAALAERGKTPAIWVLVVLAAAALLAVVTYVIRGVWRTRGVRGTHL